jgi:hypothetical protein
MIKLANYIAARAKLLESMNVPESWWYCGISDGTSYKWAIGNETIYFGDEDVEEYGEETRTEVFRGDELSAVVVQDCCGNGPYIMVLDNSKEESLDETPY